MASLRTWALPLLLGRLSLLLLPVQAGEEYINATSITTRFDVVPDGPIGVGTQQLYTAYLVDDKGAQVAVEEGFGVYTVPNVSFMGFAVTTFPDGVITSHGLFHPQTGATQADVFPITGGSGKYVHASGEYFSTLINDTAALSNIHIYF